MCHACVIESVREDMLSRRSFFKGAALAAAGATVAASAAPQPAFTQTPARVEDMTHELHEGFPSFDGGQQFFLEPKLTLEANGYNLNEWRFIEHVGTHIDAPLHFSADGKTVAELPVEDLVLPLAVVDIRAKADKDPDAQVTPEDIEAWIKANGELPQGGCVAMLSGWGSHINTEKFRNVGPDGKTMHYPGFHVDAVKYLLEASSTRAIAVDTLSLDHGPSPDFITHKTWLPTNRYGIEAVANLDRLPATGATLVVGAPKVRDGTGGPARVFALV